MNEIQEYGFGLQDKKQDKEFNENLNKSGLFYVPTHEYASITTALLPSTKLLQHKPRGKMETLPDIDDDVTPGLSVFYAASENDPCQSASKMKLGVLHEICPKLLHHTVLDDSKDLENIQYADSYLDEIKG